MLNFLFQLNFWEQWKIKLGHVFVLRVDLPSVEWSRYSGLVSLPPSPLSLKQYRMLLWWFVRECRVDRIYR